MNKKLKELREAFASFQKEYMISKGYVSDPATQSKDNDFDTIKYKQDSMACMMANLHSRMNNLEDAHYAHASMSNGHLPPCKSPSQMQAALKTLGLDKDYDIKKPQIYMKASRGNGNELVAEYRKSATPKTEPSLQY